MHRGRFHCSNSATLFIFLLLSSHFHAARIQRNSRNSDKPKNASTSQYAATSSDVSSVRTPNLDALTAPEVHDNAWKDDGIETQWRKENSVCVKKRFQCQDGDKLVDTRSDPGSPKKIKQCKYQRIAGDLKYGSACRLTDEYMLQGTEEKPIHYWVTMQMKVLNAKVRKYKKGCSTWASLDWITYKCRRRLNHIFRAASFISKAGKGPAFDRLDAEQKKEVQVAAQDARRNFASVIFKGPNSAKKRLLLEQLVQASASDKASFQRDPKAAIGRTMSVIENDLLPDDADTSVAEAKIHQIQANAMQSLPENDAAAAQQVHTLDGELTDDTDAFDQAVDAASVQMEDQADVVQAEVLKTNSSFLQVVAQNKGMNRVKWMGFTVVALLTAISIAYIGGMFMFGMIAYVGLAALGCATFVFGKDVHGQYYAPSAERHGRGPINHEADKKAQKLWKWGGKVQFVSEVGTWLGAGFSCVASFVSAPFRLVSFLYSKATRKKQISASTRKNRRKIGARYGYGA